MMTIKCTRCKKKIIKYKKIGKGRLWYCWKDRIIEDNSVHVGSEIKCQCGNLIGIDEGKRIKMRQNSFHYSGTVMRKKKI
ncbi:MAG TPA: hypothetical protein ENL46_01235 [Candidatus Aminicenantes bacterium]|nr:hypothetical protein [Candidatus Aminicenantes bacterium]